MLAKVYFEIIFSKLARTFLSKRGISNG